MDEIMKMVVEARERLTKYQEEVDKMDKDIAGLSDIIYEMAVNEYTEQKNQVDS